MSNWWPIVSLIFTIFQLQAILVSKTPKWLLLVTYEERYSGICWEWCLQCQVPKVEQDRKIMGCYIHLRCLTQNLNGLVWVLMWVFPRHNMIMIASLWLLIDLKKGHFIPMDTTMTTFSVANLFMKNISMIHGWPS